MEKRYTVISADHYRWLDSNGTWMSSRDRVFVNEAEKSAMVTALPDAEVKEYKLVPSESLVFDSAESARSYGDNEGRAEYWGSVKDIAQEAFDENPDVEEVQDDHLWESVDGSGWIIYTYKNYRVMLYTENDDAWQEMGELGDNWQTQVAFYAMLADCRDELQRIRDERENADAETEE